MREGHGKRTHGLTEVLAVTVCVEHLTVPPHQEQAVIVGSNPRRWKRTGLHGWPLPRRSWTFATRQV